jgi:hypothetical protein
MVCASCDTLWHEEDVLTRRAETLSHSLAFVILLIVFYPEVQSKIYDEAKSVWPSGSPAMGANTVRVTIASALIYTRRFP